jgi:hypothetical protein
METKTLKSLVLKTATVGVKTLTPADRIGAGVVADIDTNPATFLSPGHFQPRLPEPEPQARSRRTVADMTHMSMPSAGTPAGSVGRFPGTTVRWCPTAASSRSVGTASRACYPGSLTSPVRLGRDCQSPDRTTDATDRDAKPPAASHRKATPAAAAAK